MEFCRARVVSDMEVLRFVWEAIVVRSRGELALDFCEIALSIRHSVAQPHRLKQRPETSLAYNVPIP